MNKQLSQPEFEAALVQCRLLYPDLVDQGLGGHCDAVALAFNEVLSAHGVSSTIQAVSRTRRGVEDGQVVETNPLSHVVVEAFGLQWDILGSHAVDRWVDEWIQPDEDDEVVACEDVFEESDIDPAGMSALRRRRDAREPDASVKQQARLALTVSLGNAAIERRLIDLSNPLAWAKGYYTRGGCHELAVAMHRTHGFEIVIATASDGALHVYGLDTQGMAWDVSGARPLAAIARELTLPLAGSSPSVIVDRFIDEARFVDRCVATGDFDRQQAMPLSAYTENEIVRASQVVLDVLASHPAFPSSKPASRPRSVMGR